ncbi:MAG: TIGR04053 family radical SAM/SPASM domain-containing protein [Chloroflexi bacterium]|nr:TIGR04053 family radical SAM/SPASM domain-containing protein [Chloroflexota bacterium]
MQLIRKPAYDLNERPFLIIWETTQACDLACRHCRAEASPFHDPQALSFQEGCQLIDQVERFGSPHPLFILTGGDPFKRADIFDLVSYASQRSMPAAVSPSGTPLLNQTNLQRLKDSGAKVISLSLDGSTAAIHDDFRRVPGSYDWTLNGWRAAQSVGLKLQINTTVTRYNLFDLPNIFTLVRTMGAMTWSLFFLVPTGRGVSEDEISPEDYEAVMNFLYDASKYIGLKTTEGHHYKRVVLQRAALEARGIPPEQVLSLNGTYTRLKSALQDQTRGLPLVAASDHVRRTPMHINSGQGFIFISLRGDVFPSGYLPLKAGNVRETELKDIYQNSPLLQSLRDKDQLKGRCGLCEFRWVCGGSRSRAYAVSGDVLAEEPFCAYEPGSFPYMDDVEKLAGMGSASI